MRLRDLPIKAVYNSEHDNLLRDFYIPALSCSIAYDRAVGFFSASALSYAAQGVTAFVKNRGRMRLIIGAELEQEEHNAALRGYAERTTLSEILAKNFETVLTQVNERLFLRRLEALQWLISHNLLDIKVALRPRGMYHEKIGVLRDETGDYVVFQGSANESLHALSPDFNYESINVFRSWRQGDNEYFEAHLKSFDILWNGRSQTTVVIDFPDAARNALLSRNLHQVIEFPGELQLADQRFCSPANAKARPQLLIPPGFEVFEHQKAALDAWRKQEWKGILDLATGAGKTFTALYASTKILQATQRLFLLIAVPYQVLAEQWADEINTFGATPVLCSSRYPNWEESLARAIDLFRTGRTNFAAVVTLNATLATPRFQELIRRIKDGDNFLFVGDECHHHGAPRYSAALPDNAGLRLGLSATYERYGDTEGTSRIESYYGPASFSFSLSEAIDKGFLVPYRYRLQVLELTPAESEQYAHISRKIKERLFALRAAGNHEPFEDDIVKTLLIRRSRFLGQLESKRNRLAELIDTVRVTDKTLIYCGEGTGANEDLDSESDEIDLDELQNIDLITRIISARGYRVSKFTSRESPEERKRILNAFRSGTIQVLTAIRCLDEGLNVPACETAYILASSQNPRQFIQRRGRILRKSPGKLSATLWDFLTLPPRSSASEDHERQMLQREIRRISEFSRHSLNFKETYDALTPLLTKYDLGADFVLGAYA